MECYANYDNSMDMLYRQATAISVLLVNFYSKRFFVISRVSFILVYCWNKTKQRKYVPDTCSEIQKKHPKGFRQRKRSKHCIFRI